VAEEQLLELWGRGYRRGKALIALALGVTHRSWSVISILQWWVGMCRRMCFRGSFVGRSCLGGTVNLMRLRASERAAISTIISIVPGQPWRSCWGTYLISPHVGQRYLERSKEHTSQEPGIFFRWTGPLGFGPHPSHPLSQGPRFGKVKCSTLQQSPTKIEELGRGGLRPQPIISRVIVIPSRLSCGFT
jgi:hypothetical protein